jgi:CheY-like chemotaxis protein
VVVLDLNMPIMDGKEAFTMIQNYTQGKLFKGMQTPVLFVLTADETMETKNELSQIGCTNVINQLRLDVEVTQINAQIKLQHE